MTLPFDDDHAALYTVGQVAGMLDVQPAFLRRLDVERVVQPARSDGGQRRYSRHEIGLAQHVSQMADAGVTLPGIRRILELEAEVAALHAQIAALRSAPPKS
jgi:MerR family transcriptional regulator, heat shock protein HspR